MGARVKATPAQVDLLKVSLFTSFRSFLEMGNSRSQLQLQEEEINEITAETGFTKQQIERLYARFTSLEKKNPAKNKLNTRHEKLHFAFRMYDLDGDDKISKEELLAVLTMMVGANISPEQLLSIAERTILEA